MDEEIKVNTLFVGATRPVMFMGVPLLYFMMNAMVTFITFMAFYQLKTLAIFIPVHFLGKLLTQTEPRMIGHVFMSALQKKKCLNRHFWKCVSYSPFGRTEIK